MTTVGKIHVRPLVELTTEWQEPKNNDDVDNISIRAPSNVAEEDTDNEATPKKKRKRAPKKTVQITDQITATVIKKSTLKKKEPLPGQLRIDSYFKSAQKSYKIEAKIESACTKSTPKKSKTKTKRKTSKNRRRKRLFSDDSDTPVSHESKFDVPLLRIRTSKESIIDLCSSDDEDLANKSTEKTIVKQKETETKIPSKTDDEPGTSKDAGKICKMSLRSRTRQVSGSARRSQVETSEAEEAKADELLDLDVGATINNESVKSKIPATNSLTPTKRVTLSLRKSPKENTETQQTGADEPQIKLEVIQNELQTVCNATNNLRTKSVSPAATSLPSTSSIPKMTSTSAEIPLRCSDSVSKEQSSKAEHANPKPNNAWEEPIALACSEGDDTICISSDDEVDQENLDVRPSTSKKSINRGARLPMKTKNTAKAKQPQAKRQKKPKPPCPPYKVVEGTTFAVDAFRYGDIAGVTHYFLTHFHADHYVGLNRQFAHKIYMSAITASLIRVFIPLNEQYMNELELNKPIEIEDVEVTALDANHCPGAIMLLFKTRTGRCTLHVGDFRACPEMESEPVFWNNDIHTIYLDTTYISKNYAFCSQCESIERAIRLIEEFREKNVGTRILYVCGSYLIGKEKFWSALAQRFKFKVWTEGNRLKALNAIKDAEILSLLTDQPLAANMHVIPIVKMGYQALEQYLNGFSDNFDLIFALRPSGWEKNSKPQYRGKINIIGIEYSEHSSHDELKRFVRYLKPQKVISTVPISSNFMETANIPKKWYNYNGFNRQGFQPSITGYFKLNVKNYTQLRTRVESSFESTKINCGNSNFNETSAMFVSQLVQPEKENDEEEEDNIEGNVTNEALNDKPMAVKMESIVLSASDDWLP